MPSESGLTNQDSDYAQHIQEVLNELRQMQQTPQLGRVDEFIIPG